MVRKRIFLAAMSAMILGSITGCTTTAYQNVSFIEQLPPGVSTAFVRDDSVWMVQGSKKKIVKIGDGASDVQFKQEGPYLIAPWQKSKTFYLQYSDGEVGVLELPGK